MDRDGVVGGVERLIALITAAAAPGWISSTDLGSGTGTHTVRALCASITRAGIW